jgi:hypothetical protein
MWDASISGQNVKLLNATSYELGSIWVSEEKVLATPHKTDDAPTFATVQQATILGEDTVTIVINSSLVPPIMSRCGGVVAALVGRSGECSRAQLSYGGL